MCSESRPAILPWCFLCYTSLPPAFEASCSCVLTASFLVSLCPHVLWLPEGPGVQVQVEDLTKAAWFPLSHPPLESHNEWVTCLESSPGVLIYHQGGEILAVMSEGPLSMEWSSESDMDNKNFWLESLFEVKGGYESFFSPIFSWVFVCWAPVCARL